MKKLKTHLNKYNNNGPFPIYGTDYINEVKKEIKMLEKTSIDYDELPVVCCKHCKSLHITVDEEFNDVCNRCGSVNELEVLDDIDTYEKKYGNIWK